MSIPTQSADTFVPFAAYNFGQNGTFKHTSRLPWNPIVYCLIASFHAVTYWMSLELTIHVFYTFKRRAKLYFWSILISITSIIITTVLLDLIIFILPLTNFIILTIQRTFTTVMYAAFAMVLYSRLHLVTTNQKLLRAVLYTIIATGVIFNIPNLLFLCIPVLYQSLIMFQVTYSLNIVFALQEIILSSMYIYLFFKFVRAGRVEGSRFSPRDKTTFKLLILAQLVVLISDVAMVVLIYIRYNLLRMTMVQFTYALKLRLEFVVLNRLAGPEKSRRQTVADNYDLTSESQSSEGRREASWRSWVRILWPKRLCIPEMPVCNTDASMECGEKHAESTTTMMIRHHVSMPASPSGQSSDLGRKASNPEENCARHGSNDNPDSLCIDAMERRYLGQFEVEGMV